MTTHKIDMSELLPAIEAIGPPLTDWQKRLVAELPAGALNLNGFWEPIAPSPPRRRRVEIKLDRHRPAFVAYAVVDEALGFTLTGDEALRYARYYSPKWRAYMKRIRTAYRARQRRRR